MFGPSRQNNDKSDRSVTLRELKEGMARWKPAILTALTGSSMTVLDLVSDLVVLAVRNSENINVDKERDLILAALADLNEAGRIRISGFYPEGVFITSNF